MDFRLATTLGILLASSAVGVVWFERSRPSSRVIALVASLTALAVASRLVLAPIPNVVGTTDVALLTGYALGGAARLHGRGARRADLEHLARTGAVDRLADGGLGAGRPRGWRARRGRRDGRLGGSAWLLPAARWDSSTARFSTSR